MLEQRRLPPLQHHEVLGLVVGLAANLLALEATELLVGCAGGFGPMGTVG
jgi:hypothetical protein